jgi:ATPase subunit of ABC transporter with duplicated ATPase domains
VADLDFSTLALYPGNYDEYMLASAQSRERQSAANSRAKERISDLQDFVRRFSANKSKARQATSRQKQVDKLKESMVEIKPSSRQNPFIRFEQAKPLFRQAFDVQSISKTYEGMDYPVLNKVSLRVDAGERIAIIGANGAGKSTLIKCVAGTEVSGGVPINAGEVKWAENANIGFMPQDVSEFFDKSLTLLDWVAQYRQEGDDEQVVRGMLGRLLFSGDEIGKKVMVLSGGEKGRMFYSKLMMGKHNVLLLDEPTNHMDMESIETLQIALEKYQGTLVFVSHDREFVSSLATRIVEIKDGKLIDFKGTYDEYLASQGIA